MYVQVMSLFILRSWGEWKSVSFREMLYTFFVYVHSFVHISGKFKCVVARPERSLPSHTFSCLVGRSFLWPSTLSPWRRRVSNFVGICCNAVLSLPDHFLPNMINASTSRLLVNANIGQPKEYVLPALRRWPKDNFSDVVFFFFLTTS